MFLSESTASRPGKSILNQVELLISELNGIEGYTERAKEIVSALYQLAHSDPNISHYLQNRMKDSTGYYTKIFLSIALMGGNTSQAVD